MMGGGSLRESYVKVVVWWWSWLYERVWREADRSLCSHTAKKYGGWRIDGFIISRRLLHHVRACEIRHEVRSPPLLHAIFH